MESKVIDIIKEYINDKEITVDKDTYLLTDLGLTSLDLMNLVCEFEERFNITIEDEELGNFQQVSDVVKYIEQVI